MLGKDYAAQDCSLARALEIVGERWTLLIIRDAFYGVRRYRDFQAHLDIPRAILSTRLTALVKEGVLDRQPDPGHRGRHLYELTPMGRELWPATHALLVWGESHRGTNSLTFRHALCGTKLDAGARCPACNLTPLPEDVMVAPRAGRRRSRRDDPVAVALRKPHRLTEPLAV